MRIAFWHDLPSGGGFRAMCGQASVLREMGHDIIIYTPQSFADIATASAWLPADIQQVVIPFRGPAPNHSRIDQRLGTQVSVFKGMRIQMEAHAAEVTGLLKDWAPDVLFSHPSWYFRAPALGAAFNGPSVLYLQEPLRHLHEAMPDNAWAARMPRRNRSLVRRIGARIIDARMIQQNRIRVRTEIDWSAAFTRVLVNSAYSRESILRAYGIDAYFCQLGVDILHTPNSNAAKEKVVVSLGEMAPHKGALLAVEAIGHIPADQRPPLRWFGNRVDEEYHARVLARAAQLGVDYSFQHMVPDEQLIEHLRRAACMIYCAQLEPLGLAPLEANLAGTSVVAVAEGGVRETIVHGVNGSLVLNRDARALALEVARYTGDLGFACSSGQRAREHAAAHHNWKLAGAALEQHLQTAIGLAGQR